VIANGRQANVLTAILDSADVGTLILANPL
jgi:hypothetical protein